MIDKERNTLLEKEISPYKQVFGILILAVLFIGISSLIPKSPYSTSAPIMPWIIGCGMILFYAVINSLLSLTANHGAIYYLHSIIGFVILLILVSLLSWKVSGITLHNAGSVEWLYFVFTFGYLILLTIVNLIKLFVKIARRQDNN